MIMDSDSLSSNLNHFSEEELVEVYNKIPGILAHRVTAIAFLANSFQNNNRAFFEETSTGNYWSLPTLDKTNLLFPTPTSKLNIQEDIIFNSLFDIQAYDWEITDTFIVEKPARIELCFNSDREFLIKKKGIIRFEEKSLSDSLFQRPIPDTKVKKLLNSLQQYHHETQVLQEKIELAIAELNEIISNAADNYLEIAQEKEKLVQDITISSLEKNTNVNLSKALETSSIVEDIVNNYNSNHNIMFGNYAKVTATIESIEKRRTGSSDYIVLQESDNNNYWILLDYLLESRYYCLVPKPNLIINNHTHKTIEDIFVCQGYNHRNSNKFILNKPAFVAPKSLAKWILIESGELIFS